MSKAYDATFDCIQCGYCLPSCPTYATFQKETHSPRGRIQLVKLVHEGRLTYENIRESMELCLGCRACETACPTGVQYGVILTETIDALTTRRQASRTERVARQMVFRKLLPSAHLGRVRPVMERAIAARLPERAHDFRLLDPLPDGAKALATVLPEPFDTLRARDVSRQDGRPAYRVAFFKGCVMDVLFHHVNERAVALLEAGGCDVVMTDEATCCGALQRHAGDASEAKRLAKRNIAAFEALDVDFIVQAIGGCGASLVEYDTLFEPGSAWHERAVRFTKRVRDVSEVVSLLSIEWTRPINRRVTYQPSCHLTNVQRVTREPRALIEQLPGVTFVPMDGADHCCGSAGIYNVTQYDASMRILDDKMPNVLATSPDLVVTTNPGCHLQLALGAKRTGVSYDVVHLVELLAYAAGLTDD